MYPYTTVDFDIIELMAVFGKAFLVLGLISFICAIIIIVAQWKIFSKAGEHGWAAIVPFYRDYVFAKITWGSGWMFLVPIACTIVILTAPSLMYLCSLVTLVYSVLSYWKLSKAFGYGIGFAVGMWFVGIVFFPILGFGKSQYQGVPQDALSLKREKTE